MNRCIEWLKRHKRQVAAAIFWAATVALMIFIFCMSAKNATQSGEISGNVIKKVAPIIKKDFHQLDPAGQKSFIESLQDIVRSFAHFFEFTLLGITGCCAFRFTLNCRKRGAFWAVVMGWGYALTDEIHQIFVPGRTFQFKDIIVDWLGVLLGAALAFAVFLIIKNIAKKKNNKTL